MQSTESNITIETCLVFVPYIIMDQWAVVFELSTRVYIRYVSARRSQLNIRINGACCDEGKLWIAKYRDMKMIFEALCSTTDAIIFEPKVSV